MKKTTDNDINEEEGLHFLDFLIILAKRKKTILIATISVAVISIIISLFSSDSYYEAETSIFPSQQSDVNMASQLMSQFGIFSGSGGGKSPHNNINLLVEIIKSRTFIDKLIKRFNLKEHYKVKNNNMARGMLLESIFIQPDFTDDNLSFPRWMQTSPLMRIRVRDQDPQFTADIANGIVEELNIAINNIAISEVSQRRLFLENQLKQTSNSLIEAEEDMKVFQEKTGIVEVEGQLKITVNKFTPARILDYKRIFRQLKFTETMHEIIVKQYEAAKLDEAKNATLIQVIDNAVPPQKLSSRKQWGLRKSVFITLFVFIFSCFAAMAMEVFERYFKNADSNTKFEMFKKYLSFKKN